MEPYPAFLGGLHLALEGGTKKKKSVVKGVLRILANQRTPPNVPLLRNRAFIRCY